MNVKTLKALLLVVFFLEIQIGLLGQTHSEPSRYDILISEIMAKPTPVVGLPAVEYIELHNRLHHPILLQNWQLKLGNTVKNLPDITLDSCGFVVIIAQKYLEDFAPFCDNIVTLSSLSVTDGGQSLTLYNQNGEVVHYVNYKQSWHTESIKQDGGWSLEMIDEQWPCANGWNWDSSTDPSGGTPGRANSIRNTLYDNVLVSILGGTVRDSSTLRVHFTKTISATEFSPTFFHTEPPLNILNITEVPPDFTSLDIRFAETFQTGTIYTLGFEGELFDCGGNRHHLTESLPFGLTVHPEYNELVINEILTNPYDGEKSDYVEIFNRSSHIIDMKDVIIGYGGDTLPQKTVNACSKGFQLYPNKYIVLCKQRSLTLQQYICKDEKCLIECDSLPDFAISNGIIHLTDRSLRSIDRFEYSEEMHYPKLLSTKGVSLERLYVDRATQDENNWRSAAESAGYGTPGYRNSQIGCAESNAEFAVIPEVFSPDNDGFEDFTEVLCQFSDEENRVSITFYNNRGYPVKQLANNVLCGTEAHFRWDGIDDKGQPAPAGIYVVQLECWNLRTAKSVRKRKVVSIFRQ